MPAGEPAMKILQCILISALQAASLQAQVIISDRADNPAYADGWQDGDNGGLGLGPWFDSSYLFVIPGHFFIGSATGNGGNNPQVIDTSGVSWGLEPWVILERSFVPLGVGYTFSIACDGLGFSLATEADRIDINPSSGSYRASTSEGGGFFDFQIPADGDGVIFRLTILQASEGSTAGRLRVGGTPLGGRETAAEIGFFGSHLTILDITTGPTGGYFNRILAIPEPERIAWMSVCGLAAAALFRHSSKSQTSKKR